MTGREESRAGAGCITLLPEACRTGIFVIDKPRGPTSHQVTAWVGEILGAKVGHSGTLDPQVSGVLAVMVGDAVRVARLLLQHGKEYVCLMRLHGDAPRDEIEAVAKEFSGRIYQRPPRRSAVKRNLRIRKIHELEILDVDGRLVLFRVRCDAGTYIRTLCTHMGLALGVCAHMEELRRTRSGHFAEEQAHTLHDLQDACMRAREGDAEPLRQMILPVEEAVAGMPQVVVRDTAVDAVCRGAVLAGVGVASHTGFGKGETVAVMTQKGELVALGEALVGSSAFKPGQPGLIVAPKTVLMKAGTYPRGWKKAARQS
ncbi:RNA-guided pseudouridylation complex pseudouridine synthase subunit Cbf5 [Methanoculleus sp. FWC-SCC1]|uniref:Probable tRNA pseudouridine synthase B n=1 Tax=Methanoculleus frigidifontis TaxID=2584085 RepID=A0ABT8ME23_9EURY|nr:RNA-guided pseudouridylation complex pseudouridine synthase subunit Cbf5 [Methanoculleus sp. FWC-SCC1]MDN7026181.1 RNA-guided pseudouridylation complex pseudouridine synthase subunit Cbf5 [Methanoculleus sp. FWC-SCC1]